LFAGLLAVVCLLIALARLGRGSAVISGCLSFGLVVLPPLFSPIIASLVWLFWLVVIGLLAWLGSSLLLGYCHWLPARLLVVGHWLVCFVIRLLADCRFRLVARRHLSVGWFRWLLVGSLVAWLLRSLLHGYCRYWLVACCHCHCLSVWLAYRHFARQSLPLVVIAGSRQLSLVVIAVRCCWLGCRWLLPLPLIAAVASLSVSLFGWVARSPVGCCQFRCQLGFAAAGCRRSAVVISLVMPGCRCWLAARCWFVMSSAAARRLPAAVARRHQSRYDC
jgi:hypothetical protein